MTKPDKRPRNTPNLHPEAFVNGARAAAYGLSLQACTYTREKTRASWLAGYKAFQRIIRK